MPQSNDARTKQLSHLTEHVHAAAEVSRSHSEHESGNEIQAQQQEDILNLHRQAEAAAHKKLKK